MPQQNETSLIIPASLSFPDAGIMPKDPKTKVKVRQVKKFSDLKKYSNHNTPIDRCPLHFLSLLFEITQTFYN